jgi:UDP-2-acetamido-2,6-beta-L-arabino-hexul-4-ose reductase
MKIVVTGAHGFLGWHLRCRLHALTDATVAAVGRGDLGRLPEVVRDADAVVHLAGVNRGADTDLAEANVTLSRLVADAVSRSDTRPRIVFANSIQAANGTPYGDGKAAAASVLAEAVESVGSSFIDVRLPNLFGEHGRPHYNSFVATFCHELALGRQPKVVDRELFLLHAQRAAQALMDGLAGDSRMDTPSGTPVTVAGVLGALHRFQHPYNSGDIPPLVSELDIELFNTFRAELFPARYPIPLVKRADARGELFECVRSHGGSGHAFVSTAVPGATRGEHFHLRKVERFVVIRGRGRITLRRLLTDEVVTFVVDGETPVALDMPTMWAHNITNTGDGELVTMFWTNTIFDAAHPDTYPERVVLDEPAEELALR